MAAKSSAQKNTGAQIQKLAFLIGSWHTRGEILQGASPSAKDIRGMDSYEWAAGGSCILHRIDVMMGEQRTEGIEIIGYDADRRSYSMRSYDNQGGSTVMYAILEKRGVLKFGDKKMRSVLTINKAGDSMKAKWELYESGKWTHWMNIQLDK